MNIAKRTLIILLLLSVPFLWFFCIKKEVPARKTCITVYPNRNKGFVNKKVFGNNFVGYDPVPCKFSDKEYYGHMDYGEGIWNPKRKRPVKEVIDLAKGAGITITRFPGGCGAHHYDWKKAIGRRRKHFLYGIDEFLKTCAEIDAEAVITVSYFTGTEKDAADLVEYLNSPNDGSNPNGGVDWARQRARNGHSPPYKLRYFEIGNEVWHGDHQDIKRVLAGEYAARYLKYYESMKAIDPSIKIGAVLHTQNWNKKLLKIIKEKIDFGVLHLYSSPGITDDNLGKMNAKDIFRMAFNRLMTVNESLLEKTSTLLKEKTGCDIPLAITEYNGGFVQESPIPYRHCLGTALLNAEMLRISMKPEYNILMANYWNFVNEYWGMIASKTNFMGHNYRKPIRYIKRPNYYVYELYNKHFGDILVDVKRKSVFWRNIFRIPCLSVNASKNRSGDRVYLMVINKNMDESITSTIELKDFWPEQKGDAWVLNGPGVNATNETNPNNVRVRHEEIKIKNNIFKFAFQPHSATAIEMKREN